MMGPALPLQQAAADLRRAIGGLALAACLYAAGLPAWSQPRIGLEVLPAPPQPGAVQLRPEPPATDTEIWHLSDGRLGVRNVDRPTLQPFLPAGPRSGAAVIVAPGGGFRGLAIDAEGFDVARWLAGHGIVAFVLKYRVLPTPVPQGEFIQLIADAVRGTRPDARPPDDTPAEALADGLAALRHVRTHAAAYGLDPARVGVMGFSAGGFLTRTLIERGDSERPDFAIAVYPKMGPLNVPRNPPPLFALIAQDDFLLRGLRGFPLIDSYRDAGGAVEFHLLAGGGHGFGLGRPGTASQDWPVLLQRWLAMQGHLTRPNPSGTPKASP